MSFGKQPAANINIPAPVAPTPPPNPPMFGEQARKAKGAQKPSQVFNASVIGSVPTAGQSAQKTLLGQ